MKRRSLTALIAACISAVVTVVGVEWLKQVYGLPAIWGASAVAADTGFALKQFYYWTLNAATLNAASQWGIYTAPTWLFPSDSPTPGSIVTDLNQAPQNSSGIIVGAFGGSSVTFSGTPLYEMAVITVPEPSSLFLSSFGLAALASLRRRNRH